MNRNQQTNADIAALIRAKNVLLWVVSREETRVERALLSIAASMNPQYSLFTWDCAVGIREVGAKEKARNFDALEPDAALKWVSQQKGNRAIVVLRDLHRWLQFPTTTRALRNLARELQVRKPSDAITLVVLSPSSEIHPDLTGCTTVIDYPIPEREEIGEILTNALSSLPENLRSTIEADGTREAAIDAAIGLNAEEAASCFAKSLVTKRRIDPAQIASEKKRIIAREKVLTWYDPDPRGLDSVGGLANLKGWLKRRRDAFTKKARDYGLRTPKGCFLLGLPGCGKSLTAKAVATAWGVPLLHLDLGALKGKYIGESESNLRRALATAETVSPCVLWIDEIEKGLAGASGTASDGGVAADQLGKILQWMQEKTAPVFVIATANEVKDLPPELLRKGRFDELFWIGLPTKSERREILATSLVKVGRKPEDFDLEAVVVATDKFTGAELADAVIPDAMNAAFDQDREFMTQDLLDAVREIKPMATMSERLGRLQEWAEGKTRPASPPEATEDEVRVLEMVGMGSEAN